jgi:hypothetical protein
MFSGNNLSDISLSDDTGVFVFITERDSSLYDYYQTTSVTVIEQLTVNDTRNVREQ